MTSQILGVDHDVISLFMERTGRRRTVKTGIGRERREKELPKILISGH
jgi:hypothetical protein